MKSDATSPTSSTTPPSLRGTLTLKVQGVGHIPSFKNAKRVATNRKTNKSFLRTREDIKSWMGECIKSFESQLDSAIPTIDAGIQMAPSRRSLIASSVPLDDSRQHVAEIHIYTEDCLPGEEGATIEITPL